MKHRETGGGERGRGRGRGAGRRGTDQQRSRPAAQWDAWGGGDDWSGGKGWGGGDDWSGGKGGGKGGNLGTLAAPLKSGGAACLTLLTCETQVLFKSGE